MSEQAGRIARDLLDEPHVAGHRVSVRSVHAMVEERDRDPRAVADGLGLRLADVYRALTYYHDNPDEMAEVEARRERRIDASRNRGAVTGPDDL